jgi:Methyltransferase domain
MTTRSAAALIAARQTVASKVLALTSRAKSDGVVPLGVVERVRRFGPREDPFGVSLRAPDTVTGSALPDPELSVLFPDAELGGWALGPSTLKWIRNLVRRTRPTLILEFGSGISTVCAAKFAADAHPGDLQTRVLSIEQSPDHATRTQELLRRARLNSLVRVVTAPLEEQVLEGFQTTCYRIPDSAGAGLPPADLILVDGPAGPAGIRLGTLALARPFAAKVANFVLDDALREGELGIAARWNRWPWVSVRGTIPIEKGLLVGRIDGLG